MNSLELHNLKAYCTKNNIDDAYIDSSISYEENKEELSKLAPSITETINNDDPIVISVKKRIIKARELMSNTLANEEELLKSLYDLQSCEEDLKKRLNLPNYGVKKYRCLRCGYEWLARKRNANMPNICPKCKSKLWNKPKSASP